MSLRFSRCALVACAIALAGCSKKQDPATSAKVFLALIEAGRTQEAYEGAALGLKEQQTLRFFEQTCKELGLGEYASMTSTPPAFDRNTAKLNVEIVTKSGGKQTFIVTLVDERGAWRVFSIRTPKSPQTGVSRNLFGTVGKGPAFTDALSRPMPTEGEVRQLLEDALLMFNAGVQEGSFDNFFEQIARSWQDQVTKGQITRTFQPFIDKRVDISGIRGVQPVFEEPPTITTEGLLTVKGYYPTQPLRVLFMMRFLYELPRWKLFGLDVSLVMPEE
jgi:hypothetical protein